jgi:hypothetical protein
MAIGVLAYKIGLLAVAGPRVGAWHQWDWGMVKRLAAFGVVSFVLLAACASVCQNVRESLPDAPSVQAATPEQRPNVLVEEAHSPLSFGAMSGHAGMMRPGGLVFTDKAFPNQRDADATLRKYLYPSPVRPQPGYRSGSSGSLMGRATYAASRTLVTRDGSGKARLNTSYLLRTLTSVAKDAASTPSWRRSAGEPFSDFGSTVGNDAGMNLWHEFGPSIEQLLKNHTPNFVSRIEERISHK